jgi:Uri superfamily endonuclease
MGEPDHLLSSLANDVIRDTSLAQQDTERVQDFGCGSCVDTSSKQRFYIRKLNIIDAAMAKRTLCIVILRAA